MSAHDAGCPTPPGYDEGKKIALWVNNGKRFIETSSINEVLESFKVDVVECPYEGATTLNCPKKRLQKSVERTKVFVDNLFYNQQDEDKKDKVI